MGLETVPSGQGEKWEKWSPLVLEQSSVAHVTCATSRFVTPTTARAEPMALNDWSSDSMW